MDKLHVLLKTRFYFVAELRYDIEFTKHSEAINSLTWLPEFGSFITEPNSLEPGRQPFSFLTKSQHSMNCYYYTDPYLDGFYLITFNAANFARHIKVCFNAWPRIFGKTLSPSANEPLNACFFDLPLYNDDYDDTESEYWSYEDRVDESKYEPIEQRSLPLPSKKDDETYWLGLLDNLAALHPSSKILRIKSIPPTPRDFIDPDQPGIDDIPF